MSLPLAGVRVLELAGLAPAPFCGMILADFGADVVRVDRPHRGSIDTLSRGKRSLALDLKQEDGVAALRKLCATADVLIEPFRAGVLEKLGLSPASLLAANPRLIVARLTGFGQTGPLAPVAGHDVNYLAISGALAAMGRAEEAPLFPINLLGDFAGGGLMCAFGILAALLQRQVTGRGQVVDCAMIDGSAYLNSFLHSAFVFPHKRGRNLIDSGAHFYEVYETKDGKYMAVGAIEPQFYARLLAGLQLDGEADLPHQMDNTKWEEMKVRVAAAFKRKTQEEWTAIFGYQDACVQPVLEGDSLYSHPHVQQRSMFFEEAGSGAKMPAPAPRLSSMTSGEAPAQPAGRRPEVGEHTTEVLLEAGIPLAQIKAMAEARVLEARL